MARFDPEREAHKAWLGLLQPVGLVVSPPALIKAQAVVDRNVIALQQSLLAVVERPASLYGDADAVLRDFPRLAVDVLGWSIDDIAGAPGGPPLSDLLAVPLPDYGETLRPDFAVLDSMGGGAVLMLVVVAPLGASLDKAPETSERGWAASPQARLERLLRDTGVSAGLLLNGDELRLVYAPRGESSGHLGFPIAEMLTVGGRSILGAMHMLLSEHRVFSAPDGQRLTSLLVESRKYQTEVSNRLAEQVLGALWDLLRGFQAADDTAHGRVLHDLPRSEPEQIYGGLLTVIMRLVFLLYAEDQGLMPDDPVYTRNYAIGGLFERLREDVGRHPDTMDQRYGAWAWLLVTFRMVFDGGGHGGLHLPTRHGQLFNPDEYPFLEGRPPGLNRVMGELFDAPRVSDGVIWRVLEGLLVLDGERLSYRALDVEQIGSVYESMMGFDVRTLPGRTVAVRPKHVVVDVDELLTLPGNKRAAWIKEHAECDLAAGSASALGAATTVDDVVAALGRKLSPQTSRALPPGALFLQPGEERRRSGSHYTPRELTEPIVRTTLRPVIEALGERPTPEQVLDLKVCDPAMGSGAFLVEACRQLAQHLVNAWEVHGSTPALPPDEDPLLHARRLVAQRCLYGVDKNRFAVNLAKLSLWLITLARDHAFTFLDHALKHGDSLVGLTKAQIGAFHWDPPKRDFGPLFAGITSTVDEVTGWRRAMQSLDEGDYDRRRAAWKEAEDVVRDVRLIGDLCIAAFFNAEKDKEREALRLAYRKKLDGWKAGGERSDIEAIVEELRGGERPLPPLHWEIEFPELFGRENPGFDAMVGNPPFLGGTKTSRAFGSAYLEYVVSRTPGATGNVDLAAFFVRRADALLRIGGGLGLVTTNSIKAGDSGRASIHALVASDRLLIGDLEDRQWPGASANVAFVAVHLLKRSDDLREPVAPRALKSNDDICNRGVDVFGAGFVLSSEDRQALLERSPESGLVIKPFIGAAEMNESPRLAPERFIIDFGEMSLAAASQFGEAFRRVDQLVRPARASVQQADRRKLWWMFATRAPAIRKFLDQHPRVLVVGQISKHLAFAFLPAGIVLSNVLLAFLRADFRTFAILQSGVHAFWVRRWGGAMRQDIRYTSTDCFDTFPFPENWQSSSSLEAAGQEYYEFRSALMIRNDEGLTKSYNRFHDPDERSPDILRLRELHAAMDRAVLDAYGWTDIPTDCDFFLDYEIDEETWGTKKKPYRYRWPDAVRDEVLARLLDLNQKRYQEEVAAGIHDKAGARKSEPVATPKKPKAASAKPKVGPKSSAIKSDTTKPTQPAPSLALFGDDT